MTDALYDPGTNRVSGLGPRNTGISGASRWHMGWDYAQPLGTPIHAAADGVVHYSGAAGGYGLVVVLKHQAPGGGVFDTRYGHMDYLLPFRLNQPVKMGDIIGYVGSNGISGGPHLHYEIRTWGPNTAINNAVNGTGMYKSSDKTTWGNVEDPGKFGYFGMNVYNARAPGASALAPPSSHFPTVPSLPDASLPGDKPPAGAAPAGSAIPGAKPGVAPPPSVGGKPLPQPSNTPVQSGGGQSSKVGPPLDLWATLHPNEPNPYHVSPLGSTPAPPPSPPPEGSYPGPRGLYYDEPTPAPNGFPHALPGAGQSPPPPSNISVDPQIGNEGLDGTTASPGQTLTPQAWAARKMGATAPPPSVPSPGAAPPPPVAPAIAIPPQPAPIFVPQPAAAPAPPPPAFAPIPWMQALPIFAPPRKPIDLSVLGTMIVNRPPIFPGQE
jgi:murein DD-endopeptidase MepM/ murein hydrolase activator NlpD